MVPELPETIAVNPISQFYKGSIKITYYIALGFFIQNLENLHLMGCLFFLGGIYLS